MAFLLLFVLLLPLAYLYWSQNEKFKLVSHIPGPKVLPILGNTLEFAFLKSEDLFQVIIDMKKKYGNLYRMVLGNELWVVVSDPKDLEICLSNQKLLLKSNDYTFLEPWVGKGLLTSTGKQWHSRRKAITPAFHFKILEQFLSVMDGQANILVDKWKKKKLGTIEVLNDVTLCAMDIICETSMGVSIQTQTKQNVPYYQAIRNLMTIAHKRMFNALLQPECLFKLTPLHKEFNRNLKIVNEFTDEIITQKRRDLENSKKLDNVNEQKSSNDNEEDESLYFGQKRRMALINILMESSIDGQPLTNEEIREEVNTFLFAGHDTVSSAISFILYNIAKHQHVQEKIVAEINDVFGSEPEITFGKLANLQYLERVIKESLRIFPSVPMFGRESTEEIQLSCGRVIPKGSNITLCPYLVQMDPENYPNVEQFDPDRFLADESTAIDGRGFAYIPFSAGPRNCIGQRFAMQEMKIVTMRALQSLSFRLPEGQQSPPELISELVLKPRGGIKLCISERGGSQ